MNSVYAHGAPHRQFSFAAAPQIHTDRSLFDRSHNHKTTFNHGYLIPILNDEVLPGDTFSLNATALVRLSTPLYPLMDDIYVHTEYWFVPNRLVWSNWERFWGAQDNPDPTFSSDYICPVVTVPEEGFPTGSIFDYLGMPTLISNMENPNAFCNRAFNLIYNNFYRDQNLQDSLIVNLADGPDPATNYPLVKRAKYHDLFTSSLPWLQKGLPISIPLSGSAPVVTTGAQPNFTATGSGSTTFPLVQENIGGVQGIFGIGPGGVPSSGAVQFGTVTGLQADMSGVSSITINALRFAFQVQSFLELSARSGTRYPELIYGQYQVSGTFDRFQFPEFLGGAVTKLEFVPVANTTGAASANPQGELAAFGMAHLNPRDNHGFTHSFVEHGVIIGIISTRARLTYQQGLHKKWSRSTVYDFYQPLFAHLGEQPILNKEIYCDGSSADNDVFGYNEAGIHYRTFPSQVTGYFRSNTGADSLQAWHLAQDFTVLPTLSAEFIVENAPVDRILAVEDAPQYLADIHFDYKCTRPLPIQGTPSSLMRF